MPLQCDRDGNLLALINESGQSALMCECCCEVGSSSSEGYSSSSSSSSASSTSSSSASSISSSSSSSTSSSSLNSTSSQSQNSTSSSASSQSSTSSCSTDGISEYTITATINWSTDADCDLYTKMDDIHLCCYKSRSAAGLWLDRDAHPFCAATPPAPETIAGRFTEDHSFRVWYNTYSDCEPEETPFAQSIIVRNTGTNTITVNGATVLPGEIKSWSGIAYGGYNMGYQPDYNGTYVIVLVP